MQTPVLLKTLDVQDQQNQLWLYTKASLRIIFPAETEYALKKSLQRHVRSGVLQKVSRNLYANERARSAAVDKLPALVPYLKPSAINYVSQETRLSQLGAISQMPLNYLSVMTSGSSQTFQTRYGTVQFTHTKRPIHYILAHTTTDPATGLLLADEILALKDLTRSGRKTRDLVVEQQHKTQ